MPPPTKYCKRTGCTEKLQEMPDDALLPWYVDKYECRICGEVYEHNTRTGTLEIDA